MRALFLLPAAALLALTAACSDEEKAGGEARVAPTAPIAPTLQRSAAPAGTASTVCDMYGKERAQRAKALDKAPNDERERRQVETLDILIADVCQ